MRKKLRKVHIGGDEWRYSVRGDGHGGISNVFLYSPRGSRHEIDIVDFWVSSRNLSMEKCKELLSDMDCTGQQVNVEPSEIKKYIEKNIDADGRFIGGEKWSTSSVMKTAVTRIL